MGCIFPKSAYLKEYWHLLFNGVDAIEPIPENTHWKLQDYFDPDPARPDHTYCKRGGFLPEICFDPLSYGIPPNNLEATDTSQLLGLEVAKSALEDAGYPLDHPFLKDHRVNVVLGVTGTQELVIPLGARLGHPIWKRALEDSGIPKAKQNEILERIQGDYVQWQENSFPGLLGNVIAGRIANRFNLSGTNSASDAACASSLSALHTAVMELASGKCDMSITGGADTLNDIFMHMCFSKTGVLSHTSDARPFSKDADGTVLGEGIGIMILKRLSDAQTDNDRIYAVIKSIGTSSDGKTSAIYAPDSAGQLRALTQAYSQADVDPATVGLVEAHGTGTRVGDKVEFDALKQCFGAGGKERQPAASNRTVIGSVKSMIGHTKAAAGAAGMIKAALALYNKVLPPTLKAPTPDPDLGIADSSFYLNPESRPWVNSVSGHPRRSGVSAFGFGGSNFHVVLEEHTPSKTHASWDGSVQIFAFSADTAAELEKQVQYALNETAAVKENVQLRQTIAWQAFESRRRFDCRQSHRLAVVAAKNADLIALLDEATACCRQGHSENSSIYYSNEPQKGKLGFLFPGQGSQYPGMGKDLTAVFPEALEAFEAADRVFAAHGPKSGSAAKPLHQYIFPLPEYLQSRKDAESLLRSTDVAQPAIGAVSLGMLNILKRFGVRPDIVCGHSFGELVALHSAGWMDESALLNLAAARGRYMAQAGEKEGDAGSMLAIQAPLEKIEALLSDEKLDLVLANRNSPSQGVLSGRTDEILRARKICRKKKIRAIQLPVAAAFHSSLVKDAVKPFSKEVKDTLFAPTQAVVMSNTTGRPYTSDLPAIRELLGNQIASPVLFLNDIEYMAECGVDTFVEVGPKSVLTGLASAILKGKQITAVALDDASSNTSGIEDLAHTLARIAVKGFCIDLTQWEDPAPKPVPKRMAVSLTGANVKPKNRCDLPKSAPLSMEQEKKEPQTKAQQSKASSQNGPKTNQSIKRETGMTTQRDTAFRKTDTRTEHAMKMVRQGLEAMQQLQAQTARAHEKFLETQAQATRTLADMMAQTRNLAEDPIPYYPPEPPAQVRPSTQMVHSDTAPQPVEKPLARKRSDRTAQIVDAPAPPELTTEPPVAKTAPDNGVQQILFDIVSRLTGFPVEMLEPAMNIESDLGIDSIKKVEIVSELEKQIPSCEGLTPESIGSVRTLEDICLAIAPGADTRPQTEKPAAEAQMETGTDPAVPETAPADSAKVSSVLVETISELTGFPVEMLEPSMNLESDLGIDSIKRVEILSKLEQQLEHMESISPDDMARMKTIGEITDYICNKNSGASKKKLQTQQAKKKTPVDDRSTDKPLTRQVVTLKKYPTNQIRFYNGARVELPRSRKVYITRESSGLSDRFQKEFEKAGFTAKQIDIVDRPVPVLPDAGGIVLLPDLSAKPDKRKSLQFLTAAFALVKENATALVDAAGEKGAFLCGVTFLGGRFGYSQDGFSTDPLLGGLPGFIKTAAIEFKQLLCRALDMPDDLSKCLENAEAAVALMATHGSVEMGIDGESCYIPQLQSAPLKESVPQIGSKDVFIVTGGAKGVTAACAVELAKTCAPVIALVGRSVEPFEEDGWSRDLQTPAELKKAILANGFPDSGSQKPTPSDVENQYRRIMSNRQILNTLALVESHGARVRYFCADVRDREQMASIADHLRQEYGPVSGVIHGAGVVEDKLIVDKQIDQFERVVETKVLGLDALLAATRKDDLSYLVLFSSIAARTGNQGQSDYALANEALNKTARAYQLSHPHCRVVSINWGPWEGGMVDPGLKKQFEKRGIDLIPLASGARQMISEMAMACADNLEIVIGAHLAESEKKKSSKLSRAMSVTMDRHNIPLLSDHCIDSQPVVPFALLMEYHAQAAEKSNPGLMLAGMDDMRLLKGIQAGKPVRAHINIGKCRPVSNGVQVPSTIVSSNESAGEFIHSSCQILLRETRRKPPVLSKAAFMSLQPYSGSAKQIYRDILFHGPELQGIISVTGCSQKGIEVVSTLAPAPEQWLANPSFSRWILDPMMLDAAFQAAILWTHETRGQMCLPSYIANLRLYSSFEKAAGPVRILFTVNEETQNKIKGYFTFLDKTDTVIASITGFEAVTDPMLTEKFKNRPLFDRSSILAFAEGKPSDAFGDNYKVFDKERQIARLPRPPYFFMDRVVSADHPQWEMVPGGFIEAQYDIPENEWYFAANRTKSLPFCVLLEIALQPCGWLAAYAGSALHSEERLHFRNLGGRATLIKMPDQHCGTLTVRCRMKEVSKAGGMIIQDFELKVLAAGRIVYEGTTNFGFFTQQALANQVGIRNSRYAEYQLNEQQMKAAVSYELPKTEPITPSSAGAPATRDSMPSKALLMVDTIECMSMDGGLYRNGYIKGYKKVDPSEWFFDAHFYQDPVCPGSLGVESFLQLIRFFLLKKYDVNPSDYTPVLLPGHEHEWIYRGQIVQSNKDIEIHAHIKQVQELGGDFFATADGALIVDGICIYEMTGFSVAFSPAGKKTDQQKKTGFPEKKV